MSLFKSILVATVLCMTPTVFAGDISPEQMEANFRECSARSPYWTQRWGQYVVSFERYDAVRICRAGSYSVGVKASTAGCRLDGEWKTAGFYCEEIGAMFEQ